MWVHVNSWDRCEECWLSYKRGIQHPNSLSCYKVGIPISSLKVSLDEFVEEVKRRGYVAKYGLFPFPVSLASKGVVILYFTSREEMEKAMGELRDFVKEPSFKERAFFNAFVNVDWEGGFNYRRGCPEFDRKFGDWRKWTNVESR